MKFDLTYTKRKISMFGLKCKKHSPEFLAVSGTVCVIAGAVLACNSTLKVDEILSESKEKVEKIHDVVNGKIAIPENTEYTEENMNKDLVTLYTQTGIKLVKLYLPAVIVGGSGLCMLLGANHILRKRNTALGAALATTTTLFKEYRGRVIERFGERADFELRHDVKAEEIERTIINENGEEETVKETVDVKQNSINTYSEFARCFDAGNPYWMKDPEYNKNFLFIREQEANKRLKSQGYLFLNDVYEMIGFPKTKAGHTIGWIYDKDNPIGDNQISFGIFDACFKGNHDFINGYERSVWLDFNVDGDIYEKIW